LTLGASLATCFAQGFSARCGLLPGAGISSEDNAMADGVQTH
jgi:hypothetical protein